MDSGQAERRAGRAPTAETPGLGAQLREAREARGWSLRELARRVQISASALSQIENDRSSPSVRILWSLVTELGLSMDALFGGSPAGSEGGEIVQRESGRARLDLDSGVSWERLTADHDRLVDFVIATYAVGGSSGPSEKLVRHNGREYGLVISGELELTVGFETYRMHPGDSCSFDSNEPHRLANPGDEPTTAVWLVIGRRGTDPRGLGFDGGPVQPV